MKKFLGANYEKLAVGISLLCLVIFALLSLLRDNRRESKSFLGQNGATLSQESKTITLETKTPHGLMPGELVIIDGAEPDFFNGNFTVETILFPEDYTDVALLLSSGKTISGKIKQSGAKELNREWRFATGLLSVRTKEGDQDVRIAELEQLWGSTMLTIASENDNEGESGGDFVIATYQKRGDVAEKSESASGGKWIEASSPKEGEPNYDLFTPPVLYVVNGRLETSLPEEAKPEKPPEEFGLRLVAFEKVSYRFRIRSWIGETPYLEDLLYEFPAGSGRYVRNRLQVGVPYKENRNYKPGTPSLLQTNTEDPDKMIIVNAFAVQQVRDPKTGGIRPVGRAMVKDFRLLVKPFEINSFMNETHAGQYRIVVESASKDVPAEKFTFEQNATGDSFRLALRDYKILEIDIAKSRVHFEKQAIDPPELQREWLSLPLDDK
ncbi:MAG: hypothetical protein HN494_04585 [Opitutae bacterium]|nr:hypothetical protein [Opitutae bacterium]MBT6850398.1 hypothetical protein [Opitutae bacterium]MBT7924101.1 hypothetical protein [Opitutae bacterium]